MSKYLGCISYDAALPTALIAAGTPINSSISSASNPCGIPQEKRSCIDIRDFIPAMENN
jgi:hypothetical protein